MAERRSIVIRNGDYATRTGVGYEVAVGADAAIQDRIREITTPIESYAIPAFDLINGLQEVDYDYGNVLYNLKSTPVDSLPVELITQANKEIMSKDPTLTVESVNVDFDVISRGVFRQVIKVKMPDGTIRELMTDLDGTMLRLK